MPNQNSPPPGDYSNVENTKEKPLLNNYSNVNSPGVASNTSTPVIQKMNVVRQNAAPVEAPSPPPAERTVLQKGLNWVKGFLTRKQTGSGRGYGRGYGHQTRGRSGSYKVPSMRQQQRALERKAPKAPRVRPSKVVSPPKSRANTSTRKGILKKNKGLTGKVLSFFSAPSKKKIQFSNNVNVKEFHIANKPFLVRKSTSRKMKHSNIKSLGKFPVFNQNTGTFYLKNFEKEHELAKPFYEKKTILSDTKKLLEHQLSYINPASLKVDPSTITPLTDENIEYEKSRQVKGKLKSDLSKHLLFLSGLVGEPSQNKSSYLSKIKHGIHSKLKRGAELSLKSKESQRSLEKARHRGIKSAYTAEVQYAKTKAEEEAIGKKHWGLTFGKFIENLSQNFTDVKRLKYVNLTNGKITPLEQLKLIKRLNSANFMLDLRLGQYFSIYPEIMRQMMQKPVSERKEFFLSLKDNIREILQREINNEFFVKQNTIPLLYMKLRNFFINKYNKATKKQKQKLITEGLSNEDKEFIIEEANKEITKRQERKKKIENNQAVFNKKLKDMKDMLKNENSDRSERDKIPEDIKRRIENNLEFIYNSIHDTFILIINKIISDTKANTIDAVEYYPFGLISNTTLEKIYTTFKKYGLDDKLRKEISNHLIINPNSNIDKISLKLYTNRSEEEDKIIYDEEFRREKIIDDAFNKVYQSYLNNHLLGLSGIELVDIFAKAIIDTQPEDEIRTYTKILESLGPINVIVKIAQGEQARQEVINMIYSAKEREKTIEYWLSKKEFGMALGIFLFDEKNIMANLLFKSIIGIFYYFYPESALMIDSSQLKSLVQYLFIIYMNDVPPLIQKLKDISFFKWYLSKTIEDIKNSKEKTD
jgi:hypothetical protein